MVEIEMLKQIHFLEDLPAHIMEKISELAQINDYEQDQILFKQNEVQTILYMLLKGKVLLTSPSQRGKPLALDTVLPGRTFGVPALLNESYGNFAAVCAEPCTIITLSGKKMRQLFKQDFEAGHIIMRKVVEMFKIRREMHTQQFVNSLKTLPEIKKFGN